MNIKINAADRHFSKCVRERTDYTCQGCGKQYPRESTGLHCSHYFSRGKWAIRYDKDNAFAHCYGCHKKYGSNPEHFRDHYIDCYGEGTLELLKEKERDLGRAKRMHKEFKDIVYHYREELKEMKQIRTEGHAGWLDFVSWD